MADVDGRGYLDFTDFQHFVKLMRRRRDVETVFRQLTFERDELSRSEWLSFMKSSQGVSSHPPRPLSALTRHEQSTLDDATLLAIYSKFADDKTASMTIEGFATFLQSTDNSVFSEPQTRVADDMGLPLWDYFISSSHNVSVLVPS